MNNGIAQRYRPGVLAVSPPDDDCTGDMVHDELLTGDRILDRADELATILGSAPREHIAAIADLLRPLFIKPALQSKRLRALAEWMRANDDAKDLAWQVIESEIEAGLYAAAEHAADCRADR